MTAIAPSQGEHMHNEFFYIEITEKTPKNHVPLKYWYVSHEEKNSLFKLNMSHKLSQAKAFTDRGECLETVNTIMTLPTVKTVQVKKKIKYN